LRFFLPLQSIGSLSPAGIERSQAFVANPALPRVGGHCPTCGAQQLKYYDLHAYVIMANHVHLLVLSRVAILASGILRPLGT
jgi:hypothetical protein